MKSNATRLARIRRHERVRSKVEGTSERPRLSVFRSLNHIYAQVIDDSCGKTLASASTLDPGISGDIEGKMKKLQAEAVGQTIARRAREKGIEKVVFDRGGFKYIGRVQALADGARKEGLKF
ncbi:MAG: 50S ribosomal protein L18 [Dehalococcoidales bacterium]|nr:50S ribosomal protein L18 [Dehalococcoidales bacterium]